MSIILECFLKYADMVTTPEWSTDEVRSGIETYLKEHDLDTIDDEFDANLELMMFKEMPDAAFNAYFARYAKRQVLEAIATKARQAAIKKALSGEIIKQSDYQKLSEQLLQASIALSQDEKNKEWQSERLEEALINLKFSAGLSNELSESVARLLCEER